MNRFLSLSLLGVLVTNCTATWPSGWGGWGQRPRFPKQHQCPNPWFGIQFVSIAEKDVSLSAINQPTSDNFAFFKNVMQYSQAQIDEVTNEAIDFFRTRYGLDFSQAQPGSLGEREIEDAVFATFTFSPEIEYTINFNTWIFNNRRSTRCYENRDGGFSVSFKRDTILHGEYGGAEGKPVTSNDAVVFGFYNIPVDFRYGRNPLIINYTSGSPARLDVHDGFVIINCDLKSDLLGEGTARGLSSFTPLQDGSGKFRASVRNVFTFPAIPSGTAVQYMAAF